MKIHPVAELFPMLPKAELDELANDIRDNGLQIPIVVQGDTLIDGRNRMEACRIAKVKPEFKEYTGDDPVAFIIGANIHRRHLKPGQAAMIAEKIATMPHGGDMVSKRSANLQIAVSVENAAKMLNVSPRLVADARLISNESPDLADAVMRGEMSVNKAKQQIKETETHTETKEVKKVTNGARTNGSFEDWRKLKAIIEEINEMADSIEGLKVDEQHVVPARDLCQSVADRFQKLTRKIVE